MYNEVKSKVKYMGNTSFGRFLGVRQGESLSPFLFCMFVNDLKYCLESKGVEGVTVGDLKLRLIFYADDSTLISANREGLQHSLDCLYSVYIGLAIERQLSMGHEHFSKFSDISLHLKRA